MISFWFGMEDWLTPGFSWWWLGWCGTSDERGFTKRTRKAPESSGQESGGCFIGPPKASSLGFAKDCGFAVVLWITGVARWFSCGKLPEANGDGWKGWWWFEVIGGIWLGRKEGSNWLLKWVIWTFFEHFRFWLCFGFDGNVTACL